jgi:hypothetical protein
MKRTRHRIIKVDIGSDWSLVYRLSRPEIIFHRHFRVVDVTLHQTAQHSQLQENHKTFFNEMAWWKRYLKKRANETLMQPL